MVRVSVRLDDLPLRDDLRGLTPYGAPQAPLPVALNVNENTHPVPEAVADDILDSIARALREVNRYPDREFTACARASRTTSVTACPPRRSGRRTDRTRFCSTSCRRSPARADGVRVRADLLDVSAAHSRHGRDVRAGTRGVDYTLAPEDAAAQIDRAAARRRLPVRAEQPDRHAAAST
jgi:histidinol-phosphate aminotransferase